MTDIRRTVLWMVFVTSLLFLWDGWNKHNGRPSLFSPAPKPVATATAQPSPPTATPGGTVPAPAAGAGVAAAPPAPAVVTGGGTDPTQWVTVTTDVVKASFDPMGGTLVRLELLKYQEHLERPWYQGLTDLVTGVRHADLPQGANVVLFDRSADRLYNAASGVIGVPQPITHLVPMSALPGERGLQDGQSALSVTFESAEVGGLKLRKTFTFPRGGYAVAVRHEVINGSGAPVSPQLYLQLVRDGNPPPGESSFYSTFTGPALYTDATKFHKLPFKDIDKGSVDIPKTADDGWVAMVQHYFASAWLPPQGKPREFYARKVDTNAYAVGMLLPLGSIAPGATATQESQLFVGPQEEKKLEALAPGLELVKDYGWFTILSKPIFWLLDHLHTLIGNWGWAIVCLVVLLKVAFYWLNASAYRSMAKMKAVNPRITEMRERLKDKPQQMQQEMMRIYREEKINPIGGCLPIFIQMPFFIALYWVLLSSVEMRSAPWIGWIHDLSARDPYFILPLLMTGTSLLQTWLNPTPPDPVQARMMWIMPLVFSVMFFAFPAGLVLYWLTNNALSIAQQYLINRQLGVNK